MSLSQYNNAYLFLFISLLFIFFLYIGHNLFFFDFSRPT